jgi:hypothetical protein
MADDVVDTIAQYDLDDDFPDYANEQNKELNQIIERITTCYRDKLPCSTQTNCKCIKGKSSCRIRSTV